MNVQLQAQVTVEQNQAYFMAIATEAERLGITIEWTTDYAGYCFYWENRIILPEIMRDGGMEAEALAHELVHILQFNHQVLWQVPEEFNSEAPTMREYIEPFYAQIVQDKELLEKYMEFEVPAWILQSKLDYVLDVLKTSEPKPPAPRPDEFTN